MIQIKVENRSGLDSISIKGHAMYDDFGKDIVCAGVSSIVTTSVNGILKVNGKSISYETKEGFIKIKNLTKDSTTTILLENMVDLLKELENGYSKNIKIEEVSL